MPRTRYGGSRSEEARRLRHIRDELGLTQRELATQFGVAASAVAQWETGTHTVPGPVLRLVELYEIELGLGPEQPTSAPRSDSLQSARALRTSAVAALWVAFFGTRDEQVAHPLRHVRQAALRRYCQLVGDLKGLPLKLAQMAAFADFVLPEADRAQLAALGRAAPPMSRAALCQIFVEDFGKTPRQLFAEWSPEPFATASIGQVHRARLADGRAVAVKVQYPCVVAALRLDLHHVELIDRAISLFLPAEGRREMLAEMRARMLEECDYELEARRQHQFAALFADRADIRVPRLIGEHCSRRVLTSELACGELLDAFAARADQAARARVGATVLDFFWNSFRRGVFNTDPNPGNFVFDDTGVTFLDFGRVKQFSPGFVPQLWSLMRAVLERDRARMRTVLCEVGAVSDTKAYDFEHIFRGLLLLHRPVLTDGPFTYGEDHLRQVWRALVSKNPNLARTRFTSDMAFLHQYHFGVNALLARLGATLDYRGTMLDLLYSPGERRPPPFTSAELALLGL
jgi:transcriptional regulator with XRE-family HTH domain